MSQIKDTFRFRVGMDENGLGARLGPMLTTAILAKTDEQGAKWLQRKLSPAVAKDLGDSKRLVAFGSHKLGEAWARALHPDAQTPSELLAQLSSVPQEVLQRRCPKRSKAQCWSTCTEAFVADDQLVARLHKHLERFAQRGVEIVCARTEVICVRQMNEEKDAGGNRFVSDLHAMERLALGLRERAAEDVKVVCGKVGGIADYPRFFGPLSGRPRATLRQERRHSAYQFPGLGELHFVQDADATDPLVMLASMVGKYVRELLMGQISGFYAQHIDGLKSVSGYHDPVTRAFVSQTAVLRKTRQISHRCFERI